MTTVGGANIRALLLIVLAGSGVGVSGCANPLFDQSDRELRRSVRQASEREIAEASQRPEPVRLERESRVSQLQIRPEIIAQLEKSAGPASYQGARTPLGATLYNDQQRTSTLGLKRAVTTAVKNNLNIEFARLTPAISRQQVTSAEAAFDATLFGSTQFNKTNSPQTSSSVGGFVSGVNRSRTDVVDTTVGIRKQLISGGQLTVQSQYTHTDNQTPGLTVSPNPASQANLVVQVDQPLLRNFGSDVSQAQIRLNRNEELGRIQELKTELIRGVTDTETAYWNLVRAQSDLQIIHRLLERGEDVLKVLKARQPFDAKPANISNAVAAVESRRADVIRAQRALRDASDRLKALMNDPDLPVGSETLLLPADSQVDQPVEFSLVDAINAAFASRPEVQRAILSIANTAIRSVVADNARLPLLNVRALARLNGLDSNTGKAFTRLSEAELVDYQIGLTFEQPIGNRAAESGFRGRRLERMQAAISFRSTLQSVVGEVKNSMRDIQTNYELINQTRDGRIAAAEDLRTLLVEEETIRSLSPEFLNLKLQRQQQLASAEQQEVQALTDYNISLARYYSVTGTTLERNQIIFDVPSVAAEPRYNDLFPDYPGQGQGTERVEPTDFGVGPAANGLDARPSTGPGASEPIIDPSAAPTELRPAPTSAPQAAPETAPKPGPSTAPPPGWRVPVPPPDKQSTAAPQPQAQPDPSAP